MNFKWSNIKSPIIVLAPMANITTLPFRSICKKMGADVVFTPMISSNAVVYNPTETLKIAEFAKEEQPVIVQLFGYDKKILAEAANIVQKNLRPAGIDINMGCPAPKITGNESGSALLRDYNKSLEIISYIRKKFSGELSVKLRLGWDNFDIKEFVQALEKVGVNAVTIHGRTAKQGYSGRADWDAIHEIASSVRIPVIGNGDITTAKEALMLIKKSGLKGIMIGRGSLGNPWLFNSIKNREDIVVSKEEVCRVIKEQTQLNIRYLNDEERAIREMRKHLAWYIKNFPGSKKLRTEAVLVKTYKDIEKLLLSLKKT